MYFQKVILYDRIITIFFNTVLLSPAVFKQRLPLGIFYRHFSDFFRFFQIFSDCFRDFGNLEYVEYLGKGDPTRGAPYNN